jgi:hypothetical protein
LKLEDGWLATAKLIKLINMMMMLARGKSSRYVQSMIVQVMIILDQRARKTAAWQMMEKNLSVFNEEAGEISFSILARCVLGDTTKNKVEHLSKIYSLLHAYTESEKEFQAVVRPARAKKSGRKKLAADSDVVQSSTVFMMQWLRTLQTGMLRVYGDKKASFKSVQLARTRMVPIPLQAHTFWNVDLATNLEMHIAKAKAKFVSNWADDYAEIWPECRPVLMDAPIEAIPLVNALSETEEETEDNENEQEVEEEPQEIVQPAAAKPKRKKGPRMNTAMSTSDSDSGSESDLQTRGVRARKRSAADSDESAGKSEAAVSKASSKIGLEWSRISEKNVRARRPSQRKKRGRRENLGPFVNDF